MFFEGIEKAQLKFNSINKKIDLNNRIIKNHPPSPVKN